MCSVFVVYLLYMGYLCAMCMVYMWYGFGGKCVLTGVSMVCA